ncbi:MAG: glutathione S-transferase family protein [Polyangiales bacterium]
MKLYFNPQSRATIARWMLEEAGVAYEIVPIDFQTREHKAPEFLAINPAGKLPALVDGDTRLFENVAIGLYIADRYPEKKLAPAIDAPERGRYLSLMVYATAQLEPAMGDEMMKLTYHPSRGWGDYASAEAAIARELGDGPYLFGEWFTAADVMIGSIFAWKRRFGSELGHASLNAYVDRLMARPAAAALRGG